jgi:hypothetical protein
MQIFSINTPKPNPRTQQSYTTQSSRHYARDIGMVQYMKIHQCYPPYNHLKKKKKTFDKIQCAFVFKALERSGTINAINSKTVPNTKLNGENLKAID